MHIKILFKRQKEGIPEPDTVQDPFTFEDAEDSCDSISKISCLIFSTKSPQSIEGNVYNYNDSRTSDKTIIYQGQKKGSRDYLIKENPYN